MNPGTYYVGVTGQFGSDTGGDYTVHAHFEEPSDTRSGALIIPLGSSFTGRIGSGSDVDYFEVQVRQAGVLTVYTTGSLDTEGTLENSTGSSLVTDDNGGGGTNFLIERTVRAGTYYVKVEGVGSNTGDYTVHVSATDDHSDTRSGATRLSLGNSHDGRIGYRYDVDYFEVQVRQAGVLTVYTTGSLDTEGTLETSDGARLERGFNEGSGRNFRIDRSVRAGTYYIKVEGFGSRTGDYTVHALLRADDHSGTRSGATSLPVGSSLPGRLTGDSDVDYFEVQVRQAGVLTVYTTTTGGFPRIKGTLENSDGAYLDRYGFFGDGLSFSNNFFIVYAVRAGTYYVKVEGKFSSSTGAYTIHALFEADDHSDTRSGATSLSVGSPLPGRIATGGDVDYFEVQVRQAGMLTVYTTGSLNTKGRLENSEGDLLATDNDGGSGRNFRIERYVSAGTYYVGVGSRGSNTGDYTVHALEGYSDTRSGATSLSVGSSLPGRIATGDDVNYFKVQVSRAGVLTVYTTGSLDTKGTLEHSDGSYLENDDNGGSGRNFRIELFVTAGTYFVKVEGAGSNTGDYIVHAQAHFEGDDHSDTRLGATSLSLGSSLSGRIATRDDVDYFEVQVSQAGVLTVYTTGSLDTKGTLENSEGDLLATDDDGGSGRNFRIERTVGAGTYYIKVEGFVSRTGDYTVHASFRGGG